MTLSIYTRKLLALSQTLHRWLAALASLDSEQRLRVATYADAIAGTLERAGDAVARLEGDPGNRAAHRQAAREFGRIAGYVETMVEQLQHHLDGRKLNGVKRRLEQLSAPEAGRGALWAVTPGLADRLAAAEGYFRALADGLRA